MFSNVNGLRSKFKLTKFQETIARYEIIAFAESKTDDFDEVLVPGFKTIYMKNRKQNKRVS